MAIIEFTVTAKRFVTIRTTRITLQNAIICCGVIILFTVHHYSLHNDS